MPHLSLKPTHTPIRAYYKALEQYGKLRFDNEGNLRGAFEDLLKKCASQFKWTLVPEYQLTRKGQHPLRIDAALIDEFHLPRGYWEAKDSKDDLQLEIQEKFTVGYPRSNILFQTPARAILVQNGIIANPRKEDQDITQPETLVRLLERFYDWQESPQQEWDRAAERFKEEIPRIASGVMQLIEREKISNKLFRDRFTAFAELCRQSINPELRDEAVEEMLVQHLLTERIFRRIFNNPEFTRRNVIAAEIEKVIDSLTSRHFSRDAFLKDLDPFYAAIEKAAESTTTYAEKQHFLNHVYERFFQGFSKKQADTHGIVYTPQPIVDFMVRSVEEVLKKEFGRSLADQGVHILDPFTGTGNFITRIMQEIPATKLQKKYENELHCNEVMLLPYYIASMNIEHAYMDKADQYQAFEGICLADTFELDRQSSLFAAENAARIDRQRRSPITVIIGNPPYNVGQSSENDANANRKYPGRLGIDARVSETYAASSLASTKSRLNDPYIKALRWATDRLGSAGLVAYVTNNGFLERSDSDGVRKHLAAEFDLILIVDLGANIRKNPHLSGTTHNVFGIKPGVCISFLVRNGNNSRPAKIRYLATERDWTKLQRFRFLEDLSSLAAPPWQTLRPDERHSWLTSDQKPEYKCFLPLGNAAVKEGTTDEALMRVYGLGTNTNRDAWAYSHKSDSLSKNIKRFLGTYNEEVVRFKAAEAIEDVDKFLLKDESRIKWSSTLKQRLKAGEKGVYDSAKIIASLYRPFCAEYEYFDRLITHRRGIWTRFNSQSAGEINVAICASGVGAERPFATFATSIVPDLNFFGPGSVPQWYPFHIHDKDGTNRRENITDWALNEFRNHYSDPSITKWDIFHYTYALLHHPEYRTRYAANLKRELPRIPYAPDFRRYAALGKELMDIHIHYEQQPEFPLERIETGKLNWRVEKMKLFKDKPELRYNSFLTLRGIPPEVSEYRLGNRSALEWIVDQYQVSTDKRSGIVNDPNRDDDPEYIVRLIGQVIHVSLETVKRTRELATLALLPEAN